MRSNDGVSNLLGLSDGFNISEQFGVHTHHTNGTETRIQIPYAGAAVFGFVIAIVFFVYVAYGLPDELKPQGQVVRKVEKLGKIIDPKTCTDGNLFYGIQFFTLLFLFYFAFIATSAAFGTFTVPIAISKYLNISKQKAATLITATSIACAIGRGSSAILAKLLPIQVLVFTQMFGVLASITITAVWGLQIVTVFWVGNCAFGLFFSPLFPSVLAWSDKYVKMTGVAFGLVNVSQGVSGFIFTWLSGYLLQYKGIPFLLYFSVGCGVVTTIILIILQVLGSFHGNRFVNVAERNEPQAEMDYDTLVEDHDYIQH
jgi:hypothetical protein